MADTATLPSIAEHGASRLPSVELDSYNIELKDDEGFIGDRASKRAFRDSRQLAQARAQGRRRPVRRRAERGDLQEDARRRCSPRATPRPPASCRARSRNSPRSWRWSSAASQDQGLEGHRADRGRRRLPRQPGRRAGDRPHRGDPQGRQGADRARADPQRSRRGRPDRRGASRADLALQGPRRDPRGRYRRHQHPRRRGRAEPEEGAGPVQGRASGSSSCGVTATRRRSTARTRSRRSSRCSRT